MSSLSAEVKLLLRFSTSPWVIIGVGNTLRSDDGVGPYIGKRLRSSRKGLVLNAESNPEEVIGKIADFKPKSILVIDAADFNGVAGEARVVDKEYLPQSSLSTHSISLNVIAEILSSDTGARVQFLGIQPKSIAFGEGLCDEVKRTADLIIARINEEISDA